MTPIQNNAAKMNRHHGVEILFFCSLMVSKVVVRDPCKTYVALSNPCKRLVANEFRPGFEEIQNDAYLSDSVYFGNPGFKLAAKPPKMQHCGTMFPVWIKDLPEKGEIGETYDLTGCVVIKENKCILSRHVRVHFCKDFQVYKMERTPTESAYCLDFANTGSDASCLNSATCQSDSDQTLCACKTRGTTRCEEVPDLCSNVTCLNYGTCLYGVDSYQCKCIKGFIGKFCEKVVNHCAKISCLNGGTCVNTLHEYACQCKNGFNGKHCQNDERNIALSTVMGLSIVLLAISGLVIARLIKRLQVQSSGPYATQSTASLTGPQKSTSRSFSEEEESYMPNSDSIRVQSDSAQLKSESNATIQIESDTGLVQTEKATEASESVTQPTFSIQTYGSSPTHSKLDTTAATEESEK